MAGMYPDNQELDIFGEKVQWPGVDSSGKFSNGSFKNPLEKPSFIPAETINLILDNLSELIKKLGGTPNNTSTTQLSDLLSLASQGDYSDRDKQKGIGLVKTVNRAPNAQECEKNEPWAASPNWVYKLLTGNAASDVNEAVTQALKQRIGLGFIDEHAFFYRGSIYEKDIDTVFKTGSYAVFITDDSGSVLYSGTLLVFYAGGSTGIIQLYKRHYSSVIGWQYRNAVNANINDWTEWVSFVSFKDVASQGDPSDGDQQKGIGLVKTVNRAPTAQECEKNEPWAASPNWVYKLLTGNAASDVNEAVTQALKQRLISWTASQGDYSDRDKQKGIGLVKTVNRAPNAQECEKNEPWAASPNWVYRLLTGSAHDDVNEAITEAMANRIAYPVFSLFSYSVLLSYQFPTSIKGYRWKNIAVFSDISLWMIEKI